MHCYAQIYIHSKLKNKSEYDSIDLIDLFEYFFYIQIVYKLGVYQSCALISYLKNENVHTKYINISLITCLHWFKIFTLIYIQFDYRSTFSFEWFLLLTSLKRSVTICEKRISRFTSAENIVTLISLRSDIMVDSKRYKKPVLEVS